MTMADENVVELLAETLSDELASVARGPDAEVAVSLSRKYESLGLQEVSQATLRRADRFSTNKAPILSATLESLARTRSIRQLSRTVLAAQLLAKQSPELYPRVAKALQVLGQSEAADEAWRAAIENVTLCGDDWTELTKFVMTYERPGALISRILKIPNSSKQSKERNFCKRLCEVVSSFGDEPHCAAKQLCRIEPSRSHDSELLFQCAVLSFRLCRFAAAARFAEHALEINPEFTTARNALRSFKSFDGERPGFSRHLRLPADVVTAVLKRIQRLDGSEFGWGWVERLQNRSFKAHFAPFDASKEDRHLQAGPNRLATFSVLPRLPRTKGCAKTLWPDPMEVLTFIEFEKPHLLFRPKGKERVLHAFVGASSEFDWGWEEVSIHLGVEQSNDACHSRKTRLWNDARKQLAAQAQVEETKLC